MSQPDRRRGRGRKPSPSPISEVALAAGLPLLRPEQVGSAEAIQELESWQPDLGVVVAFGQFLPKRVRVLPRLGYLINAHASLLPRYRGAAPIARAILAGERETGISVMRIEREMDAGPVVLARSLEIGALENAEELSGRLGELAASAILEAVEQIAEGSVHWIEQAHASATSAPKLELDDRTLDWREAAEALACRVRALAPRPGATTHLDGEPLRILSARPCPAPDPAPPGSPAPGRVRGDATRRLCVCTGDGWLEILKLQRAGGKPLDAEPFLRGRPIPDDAILGAPPPNQ